jgi:hypothetical protein
MERRSLLLGAILVENAWAAIAVWTAIYISDYILSVWSAKLYSKGASEHVMFTGSLEITPQFQDDIQARRTFSLRFLRALIFSLVTISVAWVVCVRWIDLPQAFTMLMGALICLEATAHIRHVRNIVFMKSLIGRHGLKGRIEYPRWLSLRLSSVEILGFAVLFLVAFLLSASWFFAGGALACLLTGIKHREWAAEADSAPTADLVSTDSE